MKNNFSSTISTRRLIRPASAISGLVAVGALTFGLFVPAYADEPTGNDIASALEAVTADSSTPGSEVLDDVAEVATDSGGSTAIDATVDGIEVTIPTDPSFPLTLESENGQAISIGLPFADGAENAEVVTSGVVLFDNNNASATAPVVKTDGSVQITTVIEASTGPTEYSYELTIPDGAEASLVENGSVVILAEDGAFVGGVAPAWAKDANGLDVPTHYVLVGSTLTQVVAHTSDVFAYPIVADPWLGINLFDRMATTSENGQPRYMLYRSPWGAATSVGPSGSAIFLSAGWSEASSRWPALNSKLSIHQQYDCHAVYALFKPDSWNLEKWRPNKSNWGSSALSHLCNWS